MVRAPSSSNWRRGHWYTARAEDEDDRYLTKWAFDATDRATVDNFSLAALRKVTYSTFGTRSKPGLLENFATLESRVGVLVNRLERLERVLDGFSVEDVEKAVEKSNDIDYLTEKLASLEKVVCGRSKRLDALESDKEKLKKSVLLLGENFAEVDKSVSRLVQQHEAHTFNDHNYGQLLSKVVRLETVVNNNALFTQSTLNDLDAKVGETREHVYMEYPSYSDRFTLLERNIEVIKGTIRADLLSTLSSTRTELLQRTEVMCEEKLEEVLRRDQVWAKTSALYEEVPSITGRLDSVESKLASQSEWGVISADLITTNVPGLPCCTLQEALERLATRGGEGNSVRKIINLEQSLSILKSDADVKFNDIRLLLKTKMSRGEAEKEMQNAYAKWVPTIINALQGHMAPSSSSS